MGLSPEQREKLEKVGAYVASDPTRFAKGHPLDKTVNGLNPLSIWSFVGVIDAESPGDMTFDNFDEEQYKNDCVTMQGLYEDFIGEAAQPAEALLSAAAVAHDGDKRKLATVGEVLTTQAQNTPEAIKIIARSIQAEFVFAGEGGPCLVYDCTQALDMAMNLITMQHGGSGAAVTRRAMRLQCIAPRLEVPVKEGIDNHEHVLNSLMEVGASLLDYIFAD